MAKISKLIKKDGNISLLKTKKYKDINLYIKFSFKYNKALKAKLSVLSTLLMETSNKYPSKVLMTKAKDMLYGVIADASVGTSANIINLSINYIFINPKFIEEVKEKEFVEFIEESLFNLNFDEKLFNEAIKNIKEGIARKFEVPANLANENFYRELSKHDERYETSLIDIREDIDNITLKDIKALYQKLLKSRIDVYLIGDYGKTLLNYVYKFKSDVKLSSKMYPTKIEYLGEKVDRKDVSQSTLMIAYKVPIVRNNKDYYAMFLASIMFGGIPASLLFSEVREKNSLCYMIQAKLSKYSGLLTVKTLIDAKNKDKAITEIRKQQQRMKDLDFDPSLLDVAKTILLNNSLTIDDDLDYLVDYNYNGEINNTYETIEEFSKKINEVTLKDIKRVFNKTEENYIYFLEGNKHE